MQTLGRSCFEEFQFFRFSELSHSHHHLMILEHIYTLVYLYNIVFSLICETNPFQVLKCDL